MWEFRKIRSTLSRKASTNRAENIFSKFWLYYVYEIARKYPREKKYSSSFYDSVPQPNDALPNKWFSLFCPYSTGTIRPHILLPRLFHPCTICPCMLFTGVFQRWAPALFSRFHAREREGKKERESAKKKIAKNRKRRARKIKALIRAFSSTYSVNPVLEPKATRQGGSKGLE